MCNSYGTLPLSPDVCLWTEALEGLQLLSHCEVLEGGLPEIRGKVGAPSVEGRDSAH